MIIFGLCIADGQRYEKIAGPSLETVKSHVDIVLTDDGASGICAAYNRFIAVARDNPSCRALVLMHDDVVILDSNFRAKVLSAVAEPDVGIVGAIGASGLRNGTWWSGRHPVGRVFESRGLIETKTTQGDVDVVDGLMLVLSPRAIQELHFDPVSLPGFHGYDSDICFQARSKGLRVVVRKIDLYHAAKGYISNVAEFESAVRHVELRWTQFIRPASIARRIAVKIARPLRTMAHRCRGMARHQIKMWRYGRASSVPTERTVSPEDSSQPVCPICEVVLRIPSPPNPSVTTCSECGTGITWPAPSDFATDGFFNRVVFRRFYRRAKSFRNAKKRLTWIELYCPEGLLIDIGCSTGEFIKTASQEGYEVFGIEPSPWAAAKARALVDSVTVGTIDDWRNDHPGIQPDLITMWHVLEHVPSPRKFLLDVVDLLAPNGVLAGEVPNFESELARVDFDNWQGSLLTDHFHHFTPDGLRRLLSTTGFRKVVVLPITGRAYSNAKSWVHDRNAWMRLGVHRPPYEYIRFVAEKNTGL